MGEHGIASRRTCMQAATCVTSAACNGTPVNAWWVLYCTAEGARITLRQPEEGTVRDFQVVRRHPHLGGTLGPLPFAA